MTDTVFSFPSHREEVIHACKKEIHYRAEYMKLNYDSEDITNWDLPDGYTVVLLHTVLVPGLDENGEEVSIREPTIYVVYPSPFLNCWEKPRDWKIEVKTFLPSVRIRFPNLVMLVDPDDRIITSDPARFLFLMACEDEKAVWKRMIDVWHETCFSKKAEDTIARIIEREQGCDCYDTH